MRIFIPIKEESQRVPNKNFREFGGEPLYKHTLLKFFKDEVFVDTDSDKLIEAVEKDPRLSNVVCYKRKKHLVGNEVSVVSLIRDHIETFNPTEPIVQLHVTSPFLCRQTICSAYDEMLEKQCDSVVSCNVYHSRFWREESYGFCPINHNPVKLEQTQDLPKVYEENSLFYIFNPQTISLYNSRVGIHPTFYQTEEAESLDIDTEVDWHLALKKLNNEEY